jgi:hypothetical protein
MASAFKKVLQKQVDKEKNENDSSFEEPAAPKQEKEEPLVSDNDSVMDFEETGLTQKSKEVSGLSLLTL